jgi:hypothetical protein
MKYRYGTARIGALHSSDLFLRLKFTSSVIARGPIVEVFGKLL